MNPLDKEEFTNFLQIMKNGMPIITNKTFSVKRSFSQGMPKNISDYMDKIDDKFLDSNLATIEEISYRNPKNIFPIWFVNYQKKYFEENLNHDNFFKAKLHDSFFKGGMDSFGFMKGTNHTHSLFGVIASSKQSVVNGADLETATGTHTGNYTVNNLSGNKVTVGTGILGSLYDRISHRLASTAGNINLGCYDDDGGGPSKPVNREATTGSITSASIASYAWSNVTEFALATAQQWIASIHDSVQSTYYDASGGANTGFDYALAFGTLPATYGVGAFNTTPLQLKMGHS